MITSWFHVMFYDWHLQLIATSILSVSSCFMIRGVIECTNLWWVFTEKNRRTLRSSFSLVVHCLFFWIQFSSHLVFVFVIYCLYTSWSHTFTPIKPFSVRFDIPFLCAPQVSPSSTVILQEKNSIRYIERIISTRHIETKHSRGLESLIRSIHYSS